MEVKEIKLKDSMPESLIVELSVEELAHITKWLGGLNGHTTPEGLVGFYHDSTGTFFNRFWENGLQGCLDGDSE